MESLILAVALALSNVVVVMVLAFVIVRYSKVLSTATEIIVRHQDDATDYQRKCAAEALASGRQPSMLAAGNVAPTAGRGITPEEKALERLRASATQDIDDAAGGPSL
jgi:hypothetical protein